MGSPKLSTILIGVSNPKPAIFRGSPIETPISHISKSQQKLWSLYGQNRRGEGQKLRDLERHHQGTGLKGESQLGAVKKP